MNINKESMNESKPFSPFFFFHTLPTDEFQVRKGKRQETRPLWKEGKKKPTKGPSWSKMLLLSSKRIKRQTHIFLVQYLESRCSWSCDERTSFNLASLNNISAELFVTNKNFLCAVRISLLFPACGAFWAQIQYVLNKKQKALTKSYAYTTTRTTKKKLLSRVSCFSGKPGGN